MLLGVLTLVVGHSLEYVRLFRWTVGLWERACVGGLWVPPAAGRQESPDEAEPSIHPSILPRRSIFPPEGTSPPPNSRYGYPGTRLVSSQARAVYWRS